MIFQGGPDPCPTSGSAHALYIISLTIEFKNTLNSDITLSKQFILCVLFSMKTQKLSHRVQVLQSDDVILWKGVV